MLIRRCAWCRWRLGFARWLGVESWRGWRIAFTDGICRPCRRAEMIKCARSLDG